MKTLRLVAAATALAALAGCTFDGPRYGGGYGSGPVTRAPSGVEGSWLDETGGVSSLSGGVFQTVALDTGERLSEGRYTMVGPNDVAITGISLARQRRGVPADISFNCRLSGASQLNCTSGTGANFILTRRGSFS
jgi:hypothetical protein